MASTLCSLLALRKLGRLAIFALAAGSVVLGVLIMFGHLVPGFEKLMTTHLPQPTAQSSPPPPYNRMLSAEQERDGKIMSIRREEGPIEQLWFRSTRVRRNWAAFTGSSVSSNSNSNSNRGTRSDDDSSVDRGTHHQYHVCVWGRANVRLLSIFLETTDGHTSPLIKLGSGRYTYTYVGEKRDCGKVPLPQIELNIVQWLIGPSVKAQFNHQQLTTRAVARQSAMVAGIPFATLDVGDEMCTQTHSTHSGAGLADLHMYWGDGMLAAGMPRYVPLGTRIEFSSFNDDEVKPPLKRQFLFSFAGSLTSTDRLLLAEVVEAHHLMDKYRSQLIMNSKWVSDPNAVDNNLLGTAEYRETMGNSVFTLAPAGQNLEAFRLWEAAEAGSIPIISGSKEVKAHPCGNPLRPYLEAHAPFIFVESWTDLPAVLERAVAEPSWVTGLQAQLRPWYRGFMTASIFSIEGILDRVAGLPERPLPLPLPGARPFPAPDAFRQRRPVTDVIGTDSAARLGGGGAGGGRREAGTGTGTGTALSRTSTITSPVDSGSILLTGCAQSGLQQAAVWLRRLGYRVSVGDPRGAQITASWAHGVNVAGRSSATDSSPSSPGGSSSGPSDAPGYPALRGNAAHHSPRWGEDHVVHIVGEPLKTLAALIKNGLTGSGDVDNATATADLNLDNEAAEAEAWHFVCAYTRVVGCPNYHAVTSTDLPTRLLTLRSGVAHILKPLAYWLAWNDAVQSRWPAVPIVLADADDSLIALLRQLGISVEEDKIKNNYVARARDGSRVRVPSSVFGSDLGSKANERPSSVSWTRLRLSFGADLVARVAARGVAYGYAEPAEITFEAGSERKWKRWMNIWSRQSQSQSQSVFHNVPIVVGGIGDSGTRGVMAAIEAMGVYMMGAENSTNAMRDSILYTAPLYHCNVRATNYSCCGKYSERITMSVREQLSHICTEFQRACCPASFPGGGAWYAAQGATAPHQMSVQYPKGARTGTVGLNCAIRKVRSGDGCGYAGAVNITRRMVLAHRKMATRAVQEGRTAASGLWGFKHPRTSSGISLMRDALGRGGFKYIFVVRDGRDVATGFNQRMFSESCPYLVAADPTIDEDTRAKWAKLCHEPNSIVKRSKGKKNGRGYAVVDNITPEMAERTRLSLRLWSELVSLTAEYGLRELGYENFLVLRIEDLVDPMRRDKPFERLMRFIGHQDPTADEGKRLINRAREALSGHSHSYNGGRFQDSDRVRMLKVFGGAGKIGLEHFGYRHDDWGRARPSREADGFVAQMEE